MYMGVRFKTIALYSIAIYIVLSTVFEESKIGLSKLSSIGLIICTCCCGLYILIKRYLKYNWIIIALLLFGVCLAISSFYSPASSALKGMYLYRYFTSVIIILLIINTVSTKEDIELVLHAYIVSGMILAIYLYIYYGISSLMAYGERLGGDLGNQNSIGITCASTIVFSIIYFSQRKKWLYFVPIILCIPACLFTGSRKSVLMIAICMVIFFLSQFGEKGQYKRALYIVLFFIVGYFVIENISAFSVIKERFDLLFSILGDSNNRLDVGSANRVLFISEGWESFLESPLWGQGFCFSYSKWGVYSHNNYIELLMNNGLIGFSLYYSIHLRLIINARKLNQNKSIFSNLLMVIIAIILFMDVGSVNYYVRYTLILLAVSSIIVENYDVIKS